MYGYIYKTTNLINEAIYIGRHKAEKFEPEKYIGSGTVFRRALEKYGIENFKCELLDTAETKEELNDKERYWIAKYKKDCPERMYNITIGGDAITEGLRKLRKDEEIKFVLLEEVPNYIEEGWILCALETKKKYRKIARKKWKEKHPDKVRESKLNYMRNHPEKNKDAQVRYLANEENRKKHNELVKANYHKNKEVQQQYYREYNKDPEHKAKHREAQRKWYEKQKLKKQLEKENRN